MPMLSDDNITYLEPDVIEGFSPEQIASAKNDAKERSFVFALIEDHDLLLPKNHEKLTSLILTIIPIFSKKEQPDLATIKNNVIDIFNALSRNQLLTDRTVKMVLRSIAIDMSSQLRRLIYACGKLLAVKDKNIKFIASIAAELENPATRVIKLEAMKDASLKSIGQISYVRVSKILLAPLKAGRDDEVEAKRQDENSFAELEENPEEADLSLADIQNTTRFVH